MSETILIPLRGAGGEPVDLPRTIYSHGLAGLPPMEAGERGAFLVATLRLRAGKPRTVRVEQGPRRHASVTVLGRAPGREARIEIEASVRYILRLDEDLSAFYELAREDPDLAWVVAGAGRMVRSQTVFEDVIKTLCTTNCAWSATERMVGALVSELGEAAAGGAGKTFPTPEAIAQAGSPFLKEVARAGYRTAYILAIAEGVAQGRIDLESLGKVSQESPSDTEIEERLLSLPGFGPYATAHMMMMLGRYSRPILDSWTRPTYARLTGKKKVSDGSIARRFRRYGPYAGLAFWLLLTQRWIEDPS